MKLWYKLLFLPVFILALTGCEKDSADEDSESSEAYHSKDMTEDGKVTQLQTHTIGKGIPIIIMCDKFLDKDIKSGKYREAINWAIEGLFSVHPMKSLRDYFDVYEVTAVSYANYISKTTSTAFNVRPDDHARAAADDHKAERYAKKAIGEDRIDDSVIIVLDNFSEDYRDCCNYLRWPSTYSGIPTGCAIAYVQLPLNENRSIIRIGSPKTLLHEAIGHGFAKLADEYVEDEKVDDPTSHNESVMENQKHGYARNISIESDVTKTPWADFAADSRYDFEKLGCYEGGEYQAKGVYRATENSIMRQHYLSDGSCFNVAGRVMIYKRCMNIAYGDSWKFDYEEFVKFDLEKAKAEYEEVKKQYYDYSKSMRSCAPPRFV